MAAPVIAPSAPPDAAPIAAPVPPPTAPPIAAPAPAPIKPPPTARWPGSYGLVHADKPSANTSAVPLDARDAFLMSSTFQQEADLANAIGSGSWSLSAITLGCGDPIRCACCGGSHWAGAAQPREIETVGPLQCCASAGERGVPGPSLRRTRSASPGRAPRPRGSARASARRPVPTPRARPWPARR